jgi:hypothetical protein
MSGERFPAENHEYFDFIERILRGARRRTGAGDLEALRRLAELHDVIEHELLAAITMLRAEPDPCSWSEIARVVGITRQAAQQRFRKAGGTRRPGGQRGAWR